MCRRLDWRQRSTKSPHHRGLVFPTVLKRDRSVRFKRAKRSKDSNAGLGTSSQTGCVEMERRRRGKCALSSMFSLLFAVSVIGGCSSMNEHHQPRKQSTVPYCEFTSQIHRPWPTHSISSASLCRTCFIPRLSTTISFVFKFPVIKTSQSWPISWELMLLFWKSSDRNPWHSWRVCVGVSMAKSPNFLALLTSSLPLLFEVAFGLNWSKL